MVISLDSRLEVKPRVICVPQPLSHAGCEVVNLVTQMKCLESVGITFGGIMPTATLPYLYETNVEWTDERKGELESPGLEALQVASPPEFQGHEGMWTPEHYFVASVNSCFMTTFLAIAQMSKLEVVNFDSKAVGKLDRVEGAGYQMTEIVIMPRLLIRYAKDLERARRILEKAEKNCLISNSIKSTVKLEPQEVRAEDGA